VGGGKVQKLTLNGNCDEGPHVHHTETKVLALKTWELFVWKLDYIVESQARFCVIRLHLQYWLLVVVSATEEFTRKKRNETMNMYGETRCKK